MKNIMMKFANIVTDSALHLLTLTIAPRSCGFHDLRQRVFQPLEQKTPPVWQEIRHTITEPTVALSTITESISALSAVAARVRPA